MSKSAEEELKAAFDELDVDKSGALTIDDLKALVEKFETMVDVPEEALN